jgi:hypothetical protein
LTVRSLLSSLDSWCMSSLAHLRTIRLSHH